MNVIISGGGTGGHIFPALAIANALKVLDKDINILFVGAEGKMEMEKVPAAGFPIEGLNISGLKREFTKENLSFPFKVISSILKARKIINRFKPAVAIGVGGYASGPLLYAANQKGIPTLIQEQNSYPGITNKLLAKKAEKICVAYPGMERYFPKDKIVMTGNPVREDILKIEGKKKEAAAYFKLSENKKTVLVVGGSQGARSINRSILAGLEKINNSGVQLIWQTGKFFYPEAKAVVEKLNSDKIYVQDFITKMDWAYAMADLVISRAGASTVSELCIVAKPAIMVPLPTAAEDHQTKNILSLVEKDAAILVKDNEAAQKLIDTALELINDEKRLERLKNNISALALPDSAQNIAKEVLAIAKVN